MQQLLNLVNSLNFQSKKLLTVLEVMHAEEEELVMFMNSLKEKILKLKLIIHTLVSLTPAGIRKELSELIL